MDAAFWRVPGRGNTDDTMMYPSEFSAESRTRVELEETQAGQDFNQARDGLEWSSYGPGAELRQLVLRFILRVWIVFVEEACQLGRRQVWDVARVKKESLEFLSELTSKASAEKGYDRGGRVYPGQLRRLPEMTSHITGKVLPEVMCDLERSAQWERFGDLVRSVGEAWAADKPAAAGPEAAHMRLQGSAASQLSAAPVGAPTTGNAIREDRNDLAERRKAVVFPILRAKHWSRSKLAAKAGVSKNSVYEYLAGERNLSCENRDALAQELGLKPLDLPE